MKYSYLNKPDNRIKIMSPKKGGSKCMCRRKNKYFYNFINVYLFEIFIKKQYQM